jgi:DNA ligase (NAD+)
MDIDATLYNNKGKREKNKKVKEGKCIFPFKYKWKEHIECFNTKFGDICATEINPKSRTLVKYGYCPSKTKKQSSKKPSSKKPSSKKKSTDKKATVKKIKLSFLLKKKTKKRIKLKQLPSESDIKINPELTHKMSQLSDKSRLNESFIKVLNELNDIMLAQGEGFRAKAYREAAEAIMQIDYDITDPDQLKGVRHIGTTILSKLHEYVKTGTLEILERERNNPLNVLTKVYSIGPKKAKEFIKKGITTIEDLKKNPELLTDNMKIGVKYFDDIEARIPRAEIDEYNKILQKVFKESTPPGSKMEIVGSYRRGAKDSGDIDIIITNEQNNNKILDLFMDRLKKDNILIEILSKGKTKGLTIGQIPGKRPRRLDFMYTPPDQYSFALLYFTGSKIFNTLQRQRALDLGYTLNEHGFHTMVKGVKGDKVTQEFPTEKSIFDFLGMEYREPSKRINSKSVKLISKDAAQLETKKTPDEIPSEKGPTPVKITIKVKKKKTLKKKTDKKVDNIALFKIQGLSHLKILSESELSNMIRDANDAYYCNKDPILTDNEYDILREYTEKKHPKNKAVQEGHTQCKMEVERNKVKLPYEMWSMDKIKPDTKALGKWKKKYTGPYVLSCKLDGVSGMYSTEGDEPKLYTRGNGKVGQDVSHLIPFLKLPEKKGVVIRGEFIVPKNIFTEKYASKYANPRNFVAGLVNQKKINPTDFDDLDFVAYEVIKPDLIPSLQMKFLSDSNVEVVRNATEKDVTNEILSELLVAWRGDYKYEIDGVICIDNNEYPRKSGNPEHAFAFKMVLSDQIAEAKVLDVIWTPSKDGYLKPRVQIEPVVLSGAKIEYATGFNGKFIENNRIGVGALIKLIRSGDVIPHIVSVIQPAEHPLMPSVPYVWNDTHVDIMLEDKSKDSTVNEKIITGFFKVLGVTGLGPGIVKRLIKAGYDTMPMIIDASKDDFLTVDGIKELTAEKLYSGIKEKVESASLPELMKATNIFGRGFGERRFISILTTQPDILVSKQTDGEKLELLKAIDGMAKKTAEKFLTYAPAFIEWMKKANLESRLIYKPNPTSVITDHVLNGKKWLMTGFRDKELAAKLNKVGADEQSAVSKKTFMVIVKDKDEDTGKVEVARKLGIQVLTPTEVIEKYNL